jgi:hypothetical protein
MVNLKKGLSNSMAAYAVQLYLKGLTVDQILDKMDLHISHKDDVEQAINNFIAAVEEASKED